VWPRARSSAEPRGEALRGAAVEAGERLVEQHERRRVDQRARDRRALRLTARQRARAAGRRAAASPSLAICSAARSLRRRNAVQARREHEVLAHGEARREQRRVPEVAERRARGAVGRRPPVDRDPTRARTRESREQAQSVDFPASVGSDLPRGSRPRRGRVEAVERGGAGEALRDARAAIAAPHGLARLARANLQLVPALRAERVARAHARAARGAEARRRRARIARACGSLRALRSISSAAARARSALRIAAWSSAVSLPVSRSSSSASSERRIASRSSVGTSAPRRARRAAAAAQRSEQEAERREPREQREARGRARPRPARGGAAQPDAIGSPGSTENASRWR
jgi:hypothetical protein